MADDDIIGGAVGQFIPDISMQGMLGFIIWVVGIILVGAGAGFIIYIVIQRLKFNKRIKLFRKVGNQIIPVLDDKGQFARVGTGGDYWLKLKKFKKTLPRPRLQMVKNEYWFYEREDGEWINFILKDFDDQMRKAGAYYVEEDMRLQRLGIQKNLENRFQKVTFWQKYGGMIMNIVFLMVVTICLVVLFQKMESAWTKASEMASAVRDMAGEVRNLRVQTGSGMQVVGSFFPLLFIKKWKKKGIS